MSPSSLFVWTVLSLVSRGACEDETEVSCVPLENCVLPCSFNRGENPMILWFKEAAEDIIVHIYYQGQSQFEFQHQNYRNRTSLFEEELSTGNASLLLSEVRGQDEGRYRCFSRPIDGEEEESYVNVKVSAPVLEVSLQQEAEQLLCRSEGLLHKPSVSWRNRTEALHKNQSQTHTSESGGVWSVLSSVSLPHKAPHEYSCNVSTPHSWRSATYRRSSVRHPLVSDVADSPVVILCSEPTAPVKSLVWTFNHTETILSWSGPEQVHSESWRRFVVGVSESNSLVLKHLTKGHLGLFSCELHTEHETFFIHTNITEELIISPKDTEAKPHVEGDIPHLWIYLVISILFCVLFLLLFLWKHRLRILKLLRLPAVINKGKDIILHGTELQHMTSAETNKD